MVVKDDEPAILAEMSATRLRLLSTKLGLKGLSTSTKSVISDSIASLMVENTECPECDNAQCNPTAHLFPPGPFSAQHQRSPARSISDLVDNTQRDEIVISPSG